MEITAAYRAVEALSPGGEAVEVVSDSTYVVNCFLQRWHEGWSKRGWRNSQGKPVANQDLWKPFIGLVLGLGPGRVTFRWVKGHGGDVMNDIVDRLAVEATLTQEPRAGDTATLLRPDAALGPADVIVPSAKDARLPAGHRLLVTGHRPGELGGYGDNPVAREVRRKLAEILAAKHELHPDLIVVSGLQLGAEQLGAEAAIEAGVPFVAVQPFPAPDKVWPAESRHHYAELIRHATAAVLLELKEPESKQKVAGALARRDAWLARNVEEAVVVWDGKDDYVGRLVRSLRDHLGEEEVWTLEP